MSNELTLKIIRYFIIAILFMSLMTIQGIDDLRQTHQIIFMLVLISLFSLIIKNIWITLFMLWTVFLYAFFKFEQGSIYLSNIFLGGILYFITKVAFKKEYINLFINGFLLFVAINIFYMAIQLSGYDFIFQQIKYPALSQKAIPNPLPSGFMGHISLMGVLMALAIPLLVTRGSKWAILGAFGLFVPLYISHTSLSFLMGIIGLLFALYYKIPKRIWVSVIIMLVLLGSAYLKYVDRPNNRRFIQWHTVLKYCMVHPVTGWGLDSYRNTSKHKDFKFLDNELDFIIFTDEMTKRRYEDVKFLRYWDNPHNLYISLFFEFGIVGLFLLLGYLRQNIIRFKNAVKMPNVIGLAGFIIVLLGVSVGHFPMFLARFTIFIIPLVALFEVSTT